MNVSVICLCMHVFACVYVYKWVNMHLCALCVDAQGRCKESTIVLSPLLIELRSQSNWNYSLLILLPSLSRTPCAVSLTP